MHQERWNKYVRPVRPNMVTRASGACKRVRENVAELNAGSARDDIWTLRRDRQPSDILAPIQELLEALT